MEKEYKMTEAARAARAAYLREWRKRNPDKQREYTRRSWERKAEQIQQQIQPDVQNEKG